jgi:hypothetical protein
MSKQRKPDAPTFDRPLGAQESGTGTTVWSFMLGDAVDATVDPTAYQEPDNGDTPRDNRETDSTAPQDAPEPPSSVGSPPVPRQLFGKRSFRPLAQWEGVVEGVTESGFQARLVPLTNDDKANPSEALFTSFDFSDLAHPGDQELVREGAIFYWTVGRATNPAGTVQKSSLVRFRRRPGPGRERVRRAGAKAAEIMEKTEGEK